MPIQFHDHAERHVQKTPCTLASWVTMGAMSRRHRRSPRRLATQAIELSLAAPQVVTHRVLRMASVGMKPTARDRQELLLMGSEKVIAFYQSWMAMWLQTYRAQIQLAQSLAAAAFVPVGRRGRRTRSALRRLPKAAAQVMSAGLAPVHSKAVANAKRLSRRRR